MFGFTPRLMGRKAAAYYVGVSASFFDMLVKDGRMPGARRINSRVLWDRLELDEAIEALPYVESEKAGAPSNPWDEGELP